MKLEETLIKKEETSNRDADSKQTKALTTPFPWIGSKVGMRKRLYPIFDKIKRECFVDVFGGSGSIIFGKEPENNEVYNDVDERVVHFFRTLREEEKRKSLERLAEITPLSRSIFDEMKNEWLYSDDDVRRAFAFFYVKNCAFVGHYFGVYGVDKRKGNTVVKRWFGRKIKIKDFYDRFSLVDVERLDFDEVFKKYDAPTTLFYCDPPYECNSMKEYCVPWTAKESKRFVKSVAELEGSVVVSCYDTSDFSQLSQHGFEVVVCENATCKINPSVVKNKSRTETIYFKINDYGKEERWKTTNLFSR